MKNQTFKYFFFAAAALAAMAVPAQAGVTIFSQTDGAATYAYSGGDITSPSVTGNMTIQANHNVNNLGYGYVAGQWQDAAVTGNTSANLSDYTLSFTATAFGDAPNFNGGGGITVEIQAFSAGFASMIGDIKTGGNPDNYQDWYVSSSGTTFTWNLGDSDIWGNTGSPSGPLGWGDQGLTSFDPTAPIMQLEIQADAGWFGNAPMNYGVTISNLKLEMVPEPASLAFFALGGLGAIRFLIRRKI